MAESRYDKYVIRKPAVITRDRQLEIPEKIDLAGRVDTGPLVWVASKIIREASVGLESGIISGDFTVGTGAGGGMGPHKHDDFDEMFLFMGTNPEDIDDLASIQLASDISKQIEETMQYPGQIKVTVIRETRAVDYAK